MRIRNPFVQVALILVTAFVLAVVSNAFASRERRMLLVGFYPNARVVPPRIPERVLPPPVTETAPPAGSTAAVDTAATASDPAAALVTNTTQAPAAAPPAAATKAPPSEPPVKPPADSLARFRPHPDTAYVEISGEDAMQLYRAGALFLDARRTAAYEEAHVAGARSFPVWEADVDERVNTLFSERGEPEQQNQPIVVYCTGGACEDSHMLAQKLWGIQFNNVYVYMDGFPDWQKRSGATRTGAQP